MFAPCGRTKPFSALTVADVFDVVDDDFDRQTNQSWYSAHKDSGPINRHFLVCDSTMAVANPINELIAVRMSSRTPNHRESLATSFPTGNSNS